MPLSERIRMKIAGRKTKQNFEWQRPVQATKRERCRSDYTFYNGFRLGNLVVRLGDCVFIRNTDAQDPDCPDDCDIARVLKCYDNGEKRDSRRIIVCWYSRVTAIIKSHRKIPDDVPGLHKTLDVIKEERPFETDVDVESILSSCFVEEMSCAVDPETVKKPAWCKVPFFMCRFSYGHGLTRIKRTKALALKPLQDSDMYQQETRNSRHTARRSLATELSSMGDEPCKRQTPKKRGKENVGHTKDDTPRHRDVSPEIPLIDINAKLGGKPRVSVHQTKIDNMPLSPIKTTPGRTPKRKAPESDTDTPSRKKPCVGSEASHYKSFSRAVGDGGTPGKKRPGVEPKEDQDFSTVVSDENMTCVERQTGSGRRLKIVCYRMLSNGKINTNGDPLSLSPSSKPSVSRKSIESKSTEQSNQKSLASKSKERDNMKSSPLPKPNLSYKEASDEVKLKNEAGKEVNQGSDDFRSKKEDKEKIKKIGKVRALKDSELTNLLSSDDNSDSDCKMETESDEEMEEENWKKSSSKSQKREKESKAKYNSAKNKEEPVATTPVRKKHNEAVEKAAATPKHRSQTPTHSRTPKAARAAQPLSKSTVKKRVKCEECGERFASHTALQDHQDDLHFNFDTRTPSRKNKNKKSKPSGTPTSARKRVVSKPVAVTPKMPSRLGPLSHPGTPLEEARARLHVSAVPESLPCRDKEFQDIYSFVEGKLMDCTGGCMYVSGVPGTGKTATVREVVRLLKDCSMDGVLPSFTFLEINAMKLTEPHQLWAQVWKGLTGSKSTAEHAADLLEKRFSTPAPKREPTLLLVDELDLLWTRKQDVMYNLFDWPSRTGSKLIVVAIANTMDLPERIMKNRVASRLGLTRMTFQPYSHEQLQEIVLSRLRGIDAFDPDAVQLVARKVAALSGDARRALDICRRATEIAETGKIPSSPCKSPRKRMAVVGMLHVDQAIKEMFTSPKIMAIRSCSRMEQFILQAVVAEFTRTGVEEATFGRMLEQYVSTCSFEGVGACSNSEVMRLVNSLASQRLVLTEHSRHDLALRLRLNISTEDVNYALSSRC